MARITWIHLLFVVVLGLSGCDYISISMVEKKTKATTDQSAALKSEIKLLKEELAEVKTKRENHDLVESLDRIAYLIPGSSVYSPIKFNLGILTVKLADVKPYANGSKVTLTIGNILSASLNGLKAKLDWGKVNNKGVPINESEKSKEVTFAETFHPGRWTGVYVVLEGISPNELGYVRVREVKNSAILLLGK